MRMIVTIDGPAGAGKSSAARELARRLGFRFLDTGAMYRAVTLAAMRRNHDWNRSDDLARLAATLDVSLRGDRVWLEGEDVTEAVRTPAVTAATHYAANNPGVRGRLVELQRIAAGSDSIVTEGRDQGTVVFPHAACKIFLTASAEERARRRVQDFAQRGEALDYDRVLAEQNLRDERDRRRDVGPLIPASDAIEVSTDGLTPMQVIERLEQLVRERMSARTGNDGTATTRGVHAPPKA